MKVMGEFDQSYTDHANGWVCNSCACGEIYDLSSAGNAQNAIVEFIKQTMLVVKKVPFKGAIVPKFTPPMAHYVFVAGPEGDPGSGQMTTYHYKSWKKYGTEFAKFITDNGFGELATLPAILNKKHHPTTTCQVWIWQPNAEALFKWWEETGAKLEVLPGAPEPSDQGCGGCGDDS